MLPSYRNQSIDWHSKSIDWFLRATSALNGLRSVCGKFHRENSRIIFGKLNRTLSNGRNLIVALFGQRDIMLRVEFSVENIDFVKKSFFIYFLNPQ